MVWPFTGSGTSTPPSKSPDPKQSSSTWTQSLTGPSSQSSVPLAAALDWAPTFASTVIALGVINLYGKYLRRIPSTMFIKPDMYRSRSLYGRVTSVGDGDGLQLYHMPGGRFAGWGWLRKVPTKKVDLKGNTISIRIAGIDAPEAAHFGKPAQPYAFEAQRWLTDYVRNRNVRVRILRSDQYERVIATVFIWRWGILRYDVGLEMLKRGLATTYKAKTGVEFGGRETLYKAAEAKAKTAKVGIWSLKNFESPREYKDRYSLRKK
ncbi:putative endonuclease LCL3 [Ceratocystis fimbriata CBS 114723]|uniref:Probable endonuclease LCL3 n=1 Tax=Ceratocystis fimbriata CBS 114723 TaxID=1035309 RepID=A0A2C5WUD1_9PEZI|nr:putative endonuclease LCL3 [Ceratocystis fimbriata CBS 114723]